MLLIDTSVGSSYIPFQATLRILLGMSPEQEVWQNILYKIRIPRTITAALAGIALSISGLQMQTLFRNPLAGPSVLGITSGASLGIALVILGSGSALNVYTLQKLGIGGSWLLIGAAVIGSALVFLLIMLLASRIRDNVVLLILGIMIGNITVAIVSVWQYFSQPEQVQDFILWTFGSFGGITSDQLTLFSAIVLVGVALSLLISKPLNTLLLGENYAQSMGISIQRVRLLIIAITSILAGSITAFVGPIGFIGIAVPHLTRSLFNTSNHKILIPNCGLIGAILMLLCDIVAKLPGSQSTLPINAITALIGAPVVIAVIMKQRNLGKAFK
ncbi:MAG TPA: iron ABC transporter [Microscillaceae bacterium]|nr:iron ABC transporter [Microscillaceae bacterium]